MFHQESDQVQSSTQHHLLEYYNITCFKLCVTQTFQGISCLSIDITKSVSKLIKLVKQYHQIPHIEYYLICPRCGKEGVLTTKTTISKGKYRYRKWYFYHNIYPDPKRPKFRKQKWCYLNKEQLEEPRLKQNIQGIKERQKSVKPVLEKIEKSEEIICPLCKKKFKLDWLSAFSYGSIGEVTLFCDGTKHHIRVEILEF